MLNRFSLLFVAFLAACASQPQGPQPLVQFTFQGGQSITVQMSGQNPSVEEPFLAWVSQGVYTQTPVYRQLPGVFVLTGKPRLKGGDFVGGTVPVLLPNQKDLPEASSGHLGLVRHADGTVGPEVILVYGHSLRNCCEAPQNVAIGTITQGRLNLQGVQRGDNLLAVTPLR